MTEQFIAGIIGAPFGLKGQVKVKPLSGEIDHLLRLQSVTARKDGQEKRLVIAESSAAAPLVLMRFAGYDSPEAVKALGGAELLVDRKNAAPLQPGEFYIEDLKGLSVITLEEHPPNNGILGHITTVIEGGSGDLVEIRLNNGALRLIPFREEFFTDIDLENRQVTLTNLWILE